MNINWNFYYPLKIFDRNKKVIVKDDYFSTYAYIYSEQYDNDKIKFTVNYNKKSASYEFKDNPQYANQILTWISYMRYPAYNNKYYNKYNGLKEGDRLDWNKSSYSL